jgi:DNA-binding PadR family transcriptional regulator
VGLEGVGVLSQLLALLAQRGYASSTLKQYTCYLSEFVRWCEDEGQTSWPVPFKLMARYIRQAPQINQRRIAVLNAVNEQSGRGRLEDNPDVADALVMVGLGAPAPQIGPALRRADELMPHTQRVYRGRIRAFEGWCEQRRCAPSTKALTTYLDEQSLQPQSRAQYEVAIRRWEKLPPEPAPNQSALNQTGSTNPVPPSPARTKARRRRPPFKLRPPELRLLFQLSRTGVAEHNRHALGFAGIDEKRLRRMVRDGFLNSHTGVVQPRDGGGAYRVRYYTLDQRGKNWLRRHVGGRLYCWNPNQVNHDLHLTDIFYQLPAQAQQTWMTESELIIQLRQTGQYQEGGAVDAVVILDGAPHAIEVAIGYKRADIAKKQAFIRDVFGGRGTLIT